MGPGAKTEDLIQDDLVRIAEIEITFLKANERRDIQRVTYLVIQEPVRHPYIVIVLEIVKAELGVYISDRSAITFKPLEKDGGFYLQLAVLVLGIPVTCIYIVVPQGIRFCDRIKLCEVLIQQVGSIETKIELVVAVQHSNIKVVIGCRPVVCNRRIRIIEILDIYPELIKIV